MPEPALPLLSEQDLPDALRDAFQHSMQLRGDATFFAAFAHHPELYRWYTESFYGQVFNGGQVERPLKELLRLSLSLKNGCRFCNQGNRADALAAGFSEAQLAELEDWRQSEQFSEREKAALELAEQFPLQRMDGALDAELYARLARHFSPAQILELGLVLGILSGVARFLFIYDLVEKEDNCPFHPRLGTDPTGSPTS